MKTNTEIWVILHKKTGEQFVAQSGKASWRGKGHAKNAFNMSHQKLLWERDREGTPWEVQDEWEVKEISVSRVFQLEGEISELQTRVYELEQENKELNHILEKLRK